MNGSNSSSDSDDTEYLVTRCIFFIDMGMAFLDVFGILGNSIAFCLLVFYVRSTAMYKILRALAVSDTAYLVFHLFFQILPYNRLISMPSIARFIGYNGIASTAESISVWLTVLLSVERYVAVTRPLHSHTIFTKRKIIIWITIAWVTPVIYRSTLLVLITMQHQTNVKMLSVRVFRDVTWIVQSVVPISIVTLCNTVIVWKVRNARRKWKKHSRNSISSELKSTVIPLWVISLFLLSQIPQKLHGVLLMLEIIRNDNVLPLLNAVAEACAIINSSTNIIIYFACSGQIRHRLLRVFARSTSTATFVCTDTRPNKDGLTRHSTVAPPPSPLPSFIGRDYIAVRSTADRNSLAVPVPVPAPAPVPVPVAVVAAREKAAAELDDSSVSENDEAIFIELPDTRPQSEIIS